MNRKKMEEKLYEIKYKGNSIWFGSAENDEQALEFAQDEVENCPNEEELEITEVE